MSGATKGFEDLIDRLSQSIRKFEVDYPENDFGDQLSSIKTAITTAIEGAYTNSAIDENISWLQVNGNGSKQSAQAPLTDDISPPNPQAHYTAVDNTQIEYFYEDNILCLKPNKAQWEAFGELLATARSLHAEHAGVFKAVLPHVESLRRPRRSNKDHSYSYDFKPRPSGITSIDRALRNDFPILDEIAEVLTAEDAVAKFETTVVNGGSLSNVRYRPDIEVREKNDRTRYGLPDSPIWPLQGDELHRTEREIPGVHWPYLYQSNGFGSPFACHVDLCKLIAVNYLYQGSKYWIVVASQYREQLEQRLKECDRDLQLGSCSQFLQHCPVYIATSLLKQFDIPYSIVHQRESEVVVVLANTYHQGFSGGATIAEAVNYAAPGWDLEEYVFCRKDTCPKGSVDIDSMTLRVDSQQQPLVEPPSMSPESRSTSDLEAPVDKRAVRKRKAPKGQFDEVPTREKRVSGVKEAGPILKRKATTSHGPYQNSGKHTPSFISGHFKSIVSEPQIQPLAIYNIFVNRSREDDLDFDSGRLFLLTRLFFGIGSPDAFSQLCDVCRSLREGSFQVADRPKNVTETMRTLDKLEASENMGYILKRYLLASLARKRNELVISDNGTRRTRKKPATNAVRLQRDNTIALARIMNEAYPHLKETHANSKSDYNDKLNSLRERLKAGQKWLKMTEEFGDGVLALIPTRGDYDVSNREFEKLPAAAIDLLIEVLKLNRGDFLKNVSDHVSYFISGFVYERVFDRKFYFESKGAVEIKKQGHDSQELLDLCKLEMQL